MKKFLLFVPVFFLFILAANATDYYIAANGNDNNNGTSQSSPWKSINKLNAYFSNLRPGDRVLFRRGDTFYGGIVVNKSGTAGAPITIGAYGSGEKPVITGFTTVTSWNNLGGNIWESKDAVSSLPYTNMVSVNGVNTAMGRWPNQGYLTYESHNGNSSITSSSLGGSPNWTGASIAIRKERWAIETGKVTGHSGSTITYNDEKLYTPTNGFGFFIQNDSRTLDRPNEWYYNSSSKKLRIYSVGSPIEVKIANIETLVNISNSVSYIEFMDISIIGSNSTAMQFNFSNYISTKNCDISYSGRDGIHANGVFMLIENNKISYINNSGLNLGGGCNYARVINNSLISIGVIPGMTQTYTVGSLSARGNNGLIQNNKIDSSGTSGIMYSGLNTQIKNNFINIFCTIKDDGAGICMASRDQAKGSIIDGNIILNAIGASEGTSGSSTDVSGIMIDAYGTGITISNNTIANNANIGIKIHGANNIIIKNNTAYNNGGSDWSKGGLEFLSGTNYPIRNISLQGNIFFAKTPQQVALFAYPTTSTTDDIKLFSTGDNNFYAKPIDPKSAIVVKSTNFSLQNWQAYSGQDANSKGAPKTITDVKDLRFEYNATKQSKTIPLDGNYIDVKNVSYNGSITLAPYTSAVLIRNGAVQYQPPIANAGSDQTIILPTNTVSLTGSGSVEGGTIASYNWMKQSGPSAGTIVNANAATTSVTGLVEGVYVFQLKVTDNGGSSHTASVQTLVSAPSSLLPGENVSNLVNGLDYKYYEGGNFFEVPHFSNLTPKKTGFANSFDIGVADRAESFAINFEGYIEVPTDGQYTFYTNSDDGSMLYIGNKLVVDNNGRHGAIEKSGTIGLKAGKHSISVGFFQFNWDKSLQVIYSGPGISKRAVPNSVLFRTSTEFLLPAVNPSNIVNGVSYKYYEENNFSMVPDFSKLTPKKTGTTNGFDISVANKAEGFAISFEGYIDVPTDGQYIFYTNSDDGSMLYIDNKLVVNNDGLHSAIEKSGGVGLKAGKHFISVGFFQQGGDKSLTVSYSGPSISKRSISNSALFTHSTLPLLPGLNYKYYEAGSFFVVPDFSKLNPKKTGITENFNLKVADKIDHFAISFDGFIEVPTDGQYTFYTNSDDGSMLYINNQIVVNNDGRHGAIEKYGTIGLKAGKHSISVGFFQFNWDKSLQVSYAGPGISKRLIPSSILFRDPNDQSIVQNGFNGEALSSTKPFGRQPALDNLTELSINAYPNPFITSITITLGGEAGDYKLQMLDALGRVLWTRNGSKNNGHYVQTVNTSNLQKGIYILKVIQNEKTSIIKLVK